MVNLLRLIYSTNLSRFFGFYNTSLDTSIFLCAKKGESMLRTSKSPTQWRPYSQ